MACWKKLCKKYQTENTIAMVECVDPDNIIPVKLTKNIFANQKESINFEKLDLHKIGRDFDLEDDKMTDYTRGKRIAKASLLYYIKKNE